MAQAQHLKQPRARHNWKRAVLSGILTTCTALILLTAIPILSPSTGANIADLLRTAVGPGPVAGLESISFRLQDMVNQLRSRATGDKSQIGWSSRPQNQSEPALPGSSQKAGVVQSGPSLQNIQNTQNSPGSTGDIVTAPPQIGWQPYGPTVNGYPALARTLVMMDPQRSYTGIALVRMDLFRLDLHIMPGYQEPAHPQQIVQAIPELGMVPPAEQNRLVAAFNGGFKKEHGHYGMMVNGITLLQPQDGLATVALYQDGKVRIGTWGTDINSTPNLAAFRQNCPPLIEAGGVNPNLYLDNRSAWGYTNNSDITWRTGLGITQDGRYLIFAVGNGTSAATLAEALKQAGAYMGMQLDINQYYAHFDTYQPASSSNPPQGFQLTGQRLLNEMINNPRLYLAPYPRDFFYLTTH